MKSSRARRRTTKLIAYGTEALNGAVQFISLLRKPLTINGWLTVNVQHGGYFVQ